jgi:heme-degrading monooxygenase HmoA
MLTLSAPTIIRKDTTYVTSVNFIHLDEAKQAAATDDLIAAARAMTKQPGFVAVNILKSTDGSRICTYIQWQSEALLDAAMHASQFRDIGQHHAEDSSGQPQLYDLVYCDDRSPDGFSVISEAYQGTVFINEITTIPGPKQDRLLELVIANNEIQSLHTSGYRSANFHKGRDGTRAVNYSLWDSEEHLIEAISAMADMDQNLEETMELASPDFRFYTLAFAAHA